MNKLYLGDGVYAEVNQFGELVLTTEDGDRVTNRVILEPKVLAAFEDYLKHCREIAAGLQEQDDSQDGGDDRRKPTAGSGFATRRTPE